MRFRPEFGKTFESPNITGFSYNTAEQFADMSASMMKVEGWHGLVKAQNTRAFHILEGRGLFVVAGREYPVTQGDVIFVPPNTPHDFTGQMRLFIIHSPAFQKDLIQDLE